MKQIKLTQGKHALVDKEDFKYLNQFKWQINQKGYAFSVRYVKGSGRKNTKNAYVSMHRLINKAPSGLFTDHINQI